MQQIRLEKDLRKWLFNKLKDYPIEFQPIESESTGIGIPDIYFSAELSGWIELKCDATLYNSNTNVCMIRIPFRPGQISWINKHMKFKSSNIFLFLYFRGCLYIFRNNHIQKEYYYHEFKDNVEIAMSINDIQPKQLYRILINQKEPPF